LELALLDAVEHAATVQWGEAGEAGDTVRVHVAVSESGGASGAVQSVSIPPFPRKMLREAMRLGGVMDGRQRSAAEDALGQSAGQHSAGRGASPRPPGGCVAPPPNGSGRSLAVLLRDDRGKFAAGLAQVEPVSDAGMLSYATQLGVALATGRAGAVAVLGDCVVLPEGATALDAYQQLLGGRGPSARAGNQCQVGYATLTQQRAEVSTLAPIGWVSVSSEVESPSPAEARAAGRGDAGVAPLPKASEEPKRP
jgi:hypothetical protein